MKIYGSDEGTFIEAINEKLKRLAKEAQRRENNWLIWKARGWEHPDWGWRWIFRGAEGGKD